MGFSLEQISKLLSENLSPLEIRGMLRLKQAELQHLVEEQQARLWRVEARLKQIEQENCMPNYDVVIKKIKPIKVAAIRDIIPNYKSIGLLFGELMEYLKQQGVKPDNYCAAVWHDNEYKESDVDAEALLSFEGNLPDSNRVKVYELPGVEKVACLVHHGSYNTLTQAYAAFKGSWMQANGYEICAPVREVYIVGGAEQDNESYVTELQFPVAKIRS